MKKIILILSVLLLLPLKIYGANTCLSFDGNDNVYCGLLVTGHLTTATSEAWIYPTSYPSGWGHIIQIGLWGTGGEVTLGVLLRNTGKIYVDPGGNIGGSIIPLNQWTHIAVTYNSTTIIVYVNGVWDAQYTYNQNSTSDVVSIGATRKTDTTYHEYFIGCIDEVRIYNRVISSDEVLASFKGQAVSTTGLVGEWLMQEGTGGTIADTSVNGNTGTITGASWAIIAPWIKGTQSITGIQSITF